MNLQMLLPSWAILLFIFPLGALTAYLAIRSFVVGRSGGPHAAASRAQFWPWVRRFCMVLLLLVIAIRPSVPDPNATGIRTNVDVFFVVDRTGSMAAEDYNGTSPRLDGVRSDLVSLTKNLPGARFSVIGFDSGATTQLPLTTDARAVQTWADTLVQEISKYSKGSSIDRPHDALVTTLKNAQERNPEDVRLVFFLSDGEQTVDNKPDSFEDAAQYIDGGAVLGYGTAEGGQMKEYLGTMADPDAAPTYLTDSSQDGNPPAISKIDEENLRALAEQLGVRYEHRTFPSDTAFLVQGLDFQQIADDGRRSKAAYRDIYWPFAIVLTGLFAWELWSYVATDTTRKPAKKTEVNA